MLQSYSSTFLIQLMSLFWRISHFILLVRMLMQLETMAWYLFQYLIFMFIQSIPSGSSVIRQSLMFIRFNQRRPPVETSVPPDSIITPTSIPTSSSSFSIAPTCYDKVKDHPRQLVAMNEEMYALAKKWNLDSHYVAS